MDRHHPHFIVRTSFSVLLVILFRTSTAQICDAPTVVNFRENNTVDAVVVVISIQSDVTLAFKEPVDPNNPFGLRGNNLIATKVLDYETSQSHTVNIICSLPAEADRPLDINVLVQNVNEHAPVFSQSSYDLNVNELTPIGTSVGRYDATDGDRDPISYTLTSANNAFRLTSPSNPSIIVEKLLAYHKVQSDTLTLTATDRLFSATTTIRVSIVDVDNRPPWFQPCTQSEIGTVVICPSIGYTGKIILNELTPGILPLKPGPLYAIDGDSGINEGITYSFISGNEGGVFEIDPTTGNITMAKVADSIGTIALTVMAAQRINAFQSAITSVTVSVQAKSLHKPEFQRPSYEAAVTTVGAIATDPATGQPLQIIATDDDFAVSGGFNPNIVYSIDGSSDFAIISSFLFMMTDLPEATYPLTVIATDTSSDESTTAPISVTVTGPTTTTLPPSTTIIQSTTSVVESTTDSKTTAGTTPPTSTDSTTVSGSTSQSIATTNPTSATESVTTTIPTSTSESSTTTNPTSTSESSGTTNPTVTSESSTTAITSEGSVSTSDSTASTAHTVPAPPGGYGAAEMAALGATLGVLLFISLVVIVVLAVCIRRWKADWTKIYEANMFQSSLGPGGQKGGIQYTNEAFQSDEDAVSTGSGGLLVANVLADNFMLTEDLKKSAAARRRFPGDEDASQTGSDSEKEVKPILMKERPKDDGYKSVWFKEDIDPNAKEEVRIIPKSDHNDSEDEEEPSSSGRETDEDDNGRGKTSRVVLNEADLDSGLGVKIEDPSEDSEVDETLAVQL